MLFDLEIVRKNMKYMRKLYSLSQKEIGEILSVTQHGVSQYENGQRQLNYELVQLLANYFRIPVEQFVKEDLSKVMVLNPSADINFVNDLFEIMFPVFSSEKALEDEAFRKGFKMLQNIIRDSKTMKAISSEYIYSCVELFIESYNNEETLESVANAMGLMILVLAPAYDKERQNIANAILKEKVINKQVIKDHVLRKEYIKDPLKEEFIEDNYEFILEGIRILKKASKWSDLGDYYLAVSYIMDTVNNEYDSDMNALIGEELMSTLVELENRYALAYWNKKYSFLKKNE